MRAVLDVNVLVSAILGPLGHPRRILLAWQAGAFTLITSAGIINEVVDKLQLPRIRRRYQTRIPEDSAWVLALLQSQAELQSVLPDERVVVTGDPEDDYVLATAHPGRAEYLVTGDQGLLALRAYAGLRIVTPRAFLSLLTPDETPEPSST